MENHVIISIVVLSFNHERFIKRSLRSVINQTFRDFEIIFIDNDSRDKSFELGMSVLENSGIKFYAEKCATNLGISKGFNYGLKRSKGEYVSILAGDDWWDMENLVEKINYSRANPEFEMIYGNGYTYNDKTQECKLFYKTPAISGWIFNNLLKANTINSQGVLFKHNFLRSLGYFNEESKIEDLELWLRIAQVSPIGYVHKALIFYRHNNGNNISNNFDYMLKGTEYIFKQYEKDYPKEIGLARLRQYQGFAHTLAENNPNISSLKFMIKNYKFDYLYNKQIVKCLLNMIRK